MGCKEQPDGKERATKIAESQDGHNLAETHNKTARVEKKEGEGREERAIEVTSGHFVLLRSDRCLPAGRATSISSLLPSSTCCCLRDRKELELSAARSRPEPPVRSPPPS